MKQTTAETEQSVGISLVRSIVHEFERTGRDAKRLLESAGVESSILEDSHARLDLSRYRELQRLALVESGDPAFGLTMGEHASSRRSASSDIWSCTAVRCARHSSCLEVKLRAK